MSNEDRVFYHKCGQRFFVHWNGSTGRVTYTVSGVGIVRTCPKCQAALLTSASGWPSTVKGSDWSETAPEAAKEARLG